MFPKDVEEAIFMERCLGLRILDAKATEIHAKIIIFTKDFY